MSKFFKNLFSGHPTLPPERKRHHTKNKHETSQQQQQQPQPSDSPEFDEREFNLPYYDTRRKMSTSRSGRMKHNQKVRGTLRKDLFGDVRYEEKTNIEYHVHSRSFTQELFQTPPNTNEDIKKSLENIYKLAKQESQEKTSRNNQSDSKKRDMQGEEDKVDVEQEIENMFKPVLIETTF